MTSQDSLGQQIGTRRQRMEFGGAEMMRYIPCSGGKMLDDSDSITTQ